MNNFLCSNCLSEVTKNNGFFECPLHGTRTPEQVSVVPTPKKVKHGTETHDLSDDPEKDKINPLPVVVDHISDSDSIQDADYNENPNQTAIKTGNSNTGGHSSSDGYSSSSGHSSTNANSSINSDSNTDDNSSPSPNSTSKTSSSEDKDEEKMDEDEDYSGENPTSDADSPLSFPFSHVSNTRKSPERKRFRSARIQRMLHIFGEEIFYGKIDYTPQQAVELILKEVKIYDMAEFPPWPEEQLSLISGSLVEKKLVEKEQHCSMCFKKFNLTDIVTELTCGHILHLECIKTWRRNIGGCPGCRLRLPTEIRDISSTDRDRDRLAEEHCNPYGGSGSTSQAYFKR